MLVRQKLQWLYTNIEMDTVPTNSTFNSCVLSK